MTYPGNPRQRKQHQYHSLLVQEWPQADRRAWEEACRPGLRLKPGGIASHFAEASLKDFTARYGAYLGFLQRRGILKLKAAAAAQVTRSNIKAYVAELKARVSSVTIWNCIYKLRRASQLLNAQIDFAWLVEIERELALVMVPRSKFDRLVLTQRIVEAGLTLIAEAEKYAKSNFERAQGIRNGLMIVILALSQIRLKNFVALEIGSTFKQVNGSWWISVSSGNAKNRKWIEKRIPNSFNHVIELYLKQARPIMMRSSTSDNSLWISSRTGRRFSYKNLGTLVSKITFRALGVDVSPHLFRTAAASTAAVKLPEYPHLASALLGHADPRVADEHYKRTTSLNAGKVYAALVQEYLQVDQRTNPTRV
jgi:site-specific recombinase XerD